MKRLLSAALLALAFAIGLGASASASSSIGCNGNTYTWPDQFLNYNYVTNWPLLVNDCITDMAGKVTSATTQATNAATQATNAANSATTAQNAAATATTSAATQGASITSLTIGTGSQSLTIQTGKGLASGMPIRIAKSDGSSNWMDGSVTSYNTGTGALAANITSVTGSGTAASWNVFLEGATGAQGPTGPSGSLALISTQTASNSADIHWTGLGTGYNNYLLVFDNLIPATNGVQLRIQFGEGATPTWNTSSYTYTGLIVSPTPAVTGCSSSNDAAISYSSCIAGIGNGASYGASGWASLTNIPSGGSGYSGATGSAIYQLSTSTYYVTVGGLYNGSTNPKTAVRLIFSSGNIATGTASLYGISN